jgi:predicted DCC family thiol-disulfide oxidoreductase YuxK
MMTDSPQPHTRSPVTPDTPVTPVTPVLFYDGVCGFCERTVQFILARDRRGTMRFAPLQGEFAAAFFARHPDARAIDSLILVELDDQGRERVSVRSAAVLRIAQYVGGGWRLARVLGLVPRVVRDAVYDAFARSRYRLFGRYDACPLPAPDVRARFLP